MPCALVGFATGTRTKRASSAHAREVRIARFCERIVDLGSIGKERGVEKPAEPQPDEGNTAPPAGTANAWKTAMPMHATTAYCGDGGEVRRLKSRRLWARRGACRWRTCPSSAAC